MKKRLLYLALALIAAPLLWGQSTVVCTTASPGTVIGSCASGASGFSSPVTTDPVSATGVWTFDNAANTPLTCSDGLQDSTLTAGRVTFAGASGRLSDDADLTFATDTLSATKLTVATTLTSPNLVSAAGVTEAISATAPPVPANGTTAGAAVTITASAAVPNAGAGTDGAAAGGSITLTSGAAARDTSGNADGGDVLIDLGTGVGTGTGGMFAVRRGGNAEVLVYPDASSNFTNVFIGATSRLGWQSTNTATKAGALDIGLRRQNAGILQLVSSGVAGSMGSLLYGVSVEAVSTTKAPTIAEAAELYTNGSDVDGQTVTLLNDPQAGVCYEFALTSTDTSNSFVIAPSAGETLQDAGTACATSFSATAKGSTARICAVSGGSGGLWLVMSKNGTWTCS